MALLTPLHLLKKRYRILSRVGEGGFGAVYQAEDTLLGMLIAIKTRNKGDDDILHLRCEARHLVCLKYAFLPISTAGFDDTKAPVPKYVHNPLIRGPPSPF